MTNINGFVVVYKFNTNGGGIKGRPVTRHGHFKIYATKEAAQRRSYELGSSYTTVSPINATV